MHSGVAVRRHVPGVPRAAAAGGVREAVPVAGRGAGARGGAVLGVARRPATGDGPSAFGGAAARAGGAAGRPGRRQGPRHRASPPQREPGAAPVPGGGQAHRVS